ncbi:CTP-dependent riboflavin kinase [Herbaspirillum sp. HC18]|nr:CTP-dependent riboflavin kinase [Herbaspirillum sp. HC18]
MKSLNIELEGRLCSGLGEGAVFTQLDWAVREFREKLGFAPYPGTLNLSLKGPAWTSAREWLALAAGIVIDPPQGFCAARCFPVLINDRIEGAAVRPDVGDYPADKFEILAPVGVRQELDLRDGDTVRLRVTIKNLTRRYA